MTDPFTQSTWDATYAALYLISLQGLKLKPKQGEDFEGDSLQRWKMKSEIKSHT